MFVSVPDEKLDLVKSLLDDLSRMGGVEIIYDEKVKNFIVDPKNQNPYQALKVVSVIRAIGLGVSVSDALKLMGEEVMMDVIDLKEISNSRDNMTRVKGRIIGEGGKTKKIIQEYTGVSVVISGHYITLLGNYEQIPIAKKALELLVKGREHSTVYRYLDRAEQQLIRYRSSYKGKPIL
ncbi:MULTISPECIES: KH domain-containing protein [Metallosphaera]|uniref:KH, type 1, domain protein n=3 Tax=Metallosphaera TaxID=41980 RepID=A4YEH6_METS5|nr:MULTISPECIES: KH domain-containing protein [Metallosphaera]ABP94828.1 KH, type 1, domain protein [Metallosphaera sedula DSM 5348]AIM26815.1 KH, type 1, domain protein [Metallosphaera sedula]AKV73764.1 RNA-processing protein [Metallosphaera sedula]AKV76004.1 RNA-processing protein [Metallosphaera sedula]AKV78255.1 RNA-processing protein [Metallosphaera sedula]